MKITIRFIISFIITVLLSLGVTAYTDSVKLYDLSEVLSEDESAEVSLLLEDVSKKYNIDAAVIISDEVTDGFTFEEDAHDWYEYLEYSDNCIMLFICINEGLYNVFAYGKCYEVFTLEDANQLFSRFSEEISTEDYYGACIGYINGIDFHFGNSGLFIDAVDEQPVEPVEPAKSCVKYHDYTNDGLLTYAQAENLEARCIQAGENLGIDVAIVVAEFVENGMTVKEDAISWYEYLEYSENGIMLILFMEDRDYYILTAGNVNSILDDGDIGDIEDSFLGYLSNNDYYNGFLSFVSNVEYEIKNASSGNSGSVKKTNNAISTEDLLIYLVVSIVVGFIFSFIILGIWKKKHNNVERQHSAHNYVKLDSLNIVNSHDLFLYRKVDRTLRPQSNSSSSSSGSSGRSYGGSGGKF